MRFACKRLAALRRQCTILERQIADAEKYGPERLSVIDYCRMLIRRYGRMTTSRIISRMLDASYPTKADSEKKFARIVYWALWRAEKRGKVTKIIKENSSKTNGWREAIWDIVK
jgi:hypothetical protein